MNYGIYTDLQRHEGNFVFLDELILSDQISQFWFAHLKSVSSFDCLQASFGSSASWQKFRSRQFEIAN